MRTVYATPGRALDIGRYPENDTVKVVFDVKCWLRQYPAGSIALLHQRPGDDGAAPVAGLTVGSKDAEWLVSNADVLTAGEGIATLILVNGEQVALSESWTTVIGEPVTEESETPPEPIESYMTAVIEAVESYDAMTAEAEDGDTADSEIDRTGDHPVLRLTLPRGRQGDPGDPGEPGDDGFSPVVTVTEITGGHRVTITDATGPHVFDVMDGQGGGGGDVQSVNGKTGVVVLNASDVHALPDTTQIDEVAVQSTEPTSEANKMWIDPEGEGEVQLALFSDIHSPLSKILDVTLEEESALIVTEINGTPLSAEELDMLVYAPTGTAIAAGTAYVYNGQTGLGDAYHVARTVSDAGVYWCARWMKQGGVWASEMGRSFSSGNLVQPYRYFVNELANERYGRSVIDYPKITQIKLPTLPADTRIILYAR